MSLHSFSLRHDDAREGAGAVSVWQRQRAGVWRVIIHPRNVHMLPVCRGMSLPVDPRYVRDGIRPSSLWGAMPGPAALHAMAIGCNAISVM